MGSWWILPFLMAYKGRGCWPPGLGQLLTLAWLIKLDLLRVVAPPG